MSDLPEGQKTTLSHIFEDFLIDCEARNLSTRTIGYYTYCFEWFCKTVPENTNLIDIDRNVLNRHVQLLLETNKDTSVNAHLRGLRVIFNFANTIYGSSIKVKLIKTDKQPKPTYSDEELNRLLKKPDTDTCEFSEYRDWVMTNVFMGTGCRLGSCINLRAKDINISASTIFFRKMKNRKALFLPLNNELKFVLKEYLEVTKLKGSRFLFPSQKGDKLTETGFCSVYRTYAARRDVQNAGIHKFRHTYAKQFILSGGNPAKLQRILGHSSITITMEYVNLYSSDLQDDVNKYCFLNKARVRAKTRK